MIKSLNQAECELMVRLREQYPFHVAINTEETLSAYTLQQQQKNIQTFPFMWCLLGCVKEIDYKSLFQLRGFRGSESGKIRE